MIGRVTQQTVQRSTLANLQLNLSAMATLQDRLSSSKKITKPSDDPAGTGAAIALRGALRANSQQSTNINDSTSWLTTIDTSLTDSLSSLSRARDLTVQGSNTAVMSPAARESIAVEIEGLRDALISQANTAFLGRSVFAGTSGAGAAVTVTPVPDPTVPGSTQTYTENGVAGAAVTRRIDPNTVVQVDVSGAAAFGTGASSVFATLDQIAATLRAGGDVSSQLTALDANRDAMTGQLAGVGARENQVTAAQTRALATKTSLMSQLSSVEDVDIAATVVDEQAQEVSYKAALGATARVLQPTLMDYLK